MMNTRKGSILSSYLYQLVRKRSLSLDSDTFYVPKTDADFNEQWVTRLGMTVVNDLVHIPNTENSKEIIVLGSLFNFSDKRDLIILPGIPVLREKNSIKTKTADELMVENSLVGSSDLTKKAADLVNDYTDLLDEERVNECQTTALHAYRNFFSSPTMVEDRKTYYKKIREFHSRVYGSFSLKKTPLLAAQLLLTLPTLIVVEMFKNELTYEKVFFLIEAQVPLTEWSDSMYREYPLEWLKELSFDV